MCVVSKSFHTYYPLASSYRFYKFHLTVIFSGKFLDLKVNQESLLCNVVLCSTFFFFREFVLIISNE